ncbi:hypothetical protein CR513_20934, partial [Mucuna pruriens]
MEKNETRMDELESVKCKIPSFLGENKLDAYLDWELKSIKPLRSNSLQEGEPDVNMDKHLGGIQESIKDKENNALQGPMTRELMRKISSVECRLALGRDESNTVLAKRRLGRNKVGLTRFRTRWSQTNSVSDSRKQ